MRVGATDVAVERQPRLLGDRLRGREADAQDRVRPEAALVVGAVERAQLGVERALVGAVEAHDGIADLAVDEPDRGLHALAAIALAAVAQLHGLVRAGARTARHGRPPAGAREQLDLDLDGRVAA